MHARGDSFHIFQNFFENKKKSITFTTILKVNSKEFNISRTKTLKTI